MSRISTIIESINSRLQSGVLSDQRFAGGRYLGIATYLPEGDLIKASVFDEKGSVVVDSISPNDTYPITIYHRIGSSRWVNRTADAFGSQNAMIRQMDMSMMVMYDKKRVGINSEDMEVLLYAGLPSSIKPLADGFGSCHIEFTGSEHSQMALFVRELNMKDFTLAPQSVLFEVKYKMELSYHKACVQMICCPDQN